MKVIHCSISIHKFKLNPPINSAFPAWGFPGSSDGKESTCNAGDPGLIPGLGRFPEEGNGNPFQQSYLKDFTDRGARQATQFMGSQRVGHDRVTNTHSQTLSSEFSEGMHFCFLSSCYFLIKLLGTWKLYTVLNVLPFPLVPGILHSILITPWTSQTLSLGQCYSLFSVTVKRVSDTGHTESMSCSPVMPCKNNPWNFLNGTIGTF